MRVLYFHQYFSTPQGGVGTRSFEMARHLVGAGHDVTIVCGSYGTAKTGLEGPYAHSRREGMVEGIRVIEFLIPCSNDDSLAKRTWTFTKYAARSGLLALRADYDLVFATSTPLTAAIPGLIGKWLRRKPFVFEVRDLWPELPKAMGVIKNPAILFAMAVLERRAYKAANACIGLAPGIVDGIARHVSRDKITMIPNGCDLELFGGDQQKGWRPEEIGTEDFLAVFAGTHGPANGLDAVLDAAKHLKQRGRTDIKLLLIGEGKRKAALVERAKSESLDNVVFHANVSKQQVASLFHSADVGLQILDSIPAFYFGTSPNKFFDYIAAGLPVLNNYPGWLATLIQERQCGVAVPEKDPAAFAQALIDLADNPAKRRQMGHAARQLAEDRFSRLKLAEQFETALRRASSSQKQCSNNE